MDKMEKNGIKRKKKNILTQFITLYQREIKIKQLKISAESKLIEFHYNTE